MEGLAPGALVIPSVDELREWFDRHLRCSVSSPTWRCSEDAQWRVHVSCPACGSRWASLCDLDACEGYREELAETWYFVCRLCPGRPLLDFLDLVPL